MPHKHYMGLNCCHNAHCYLPGCAETWAVAISSHLMGVQRWLTGIENTYLCGLCERGLGSAKVVCVIISSYAAI